MFHSQLKRIIFILAFVRDFVLVELKKHKTEYVFLLIRLDIYAENSNLHPSI